MYFCGNFAPVFLLMKQAPEFTKQDAYTQDELDYFFDKGMSYLKTRVSYVFVNSRWKGFSVSTFCKKVKDSSIWKFHGGLRIHL